MDGIVLTLVLIGLTVAGFALIVWGVPLVARALFASSVSEIRDRVVDAELADVLPRDESIFRFVRVCDNLLRNRRLASLSFLFAFHRTRRELGEPELPPPPYRNLDESAQAFMKQAELDLVQAMAVHMTLGSILWLPLVAARGLVKVLEHLGRTVGSHAGRPTRLALELTRSNEGPDLTVSFDRTLVAA